jgi:hypothetical protein
MADEQEFDLETGEEIVAKQPENEELENEEVEEQEEPTSTEPEGEKSGDAEMDDAKDDDEREAIRARRREERKHRKEAQREREDTLRRELASRDAIINELRQKVDVIERRNTGSELAQIQNGKKQAAQAYNFFKDQIRVAGEAGNHAAVADATEKMIQARDKFNEFDRVEKAFSQRQSAPPPLDPRLANHAEAWMKKNSWYDPSGQDQDSEIAMRIDQRLAQEGWDPTTKEYWDELSARVKKYLPHRVNSGKIERNKPRSVVSGSDRESASSKGSATYKLSSERVQALKDAGIWDDPKQRAEAIKRFREYDKVNKV